ncbi:MAG: hypothetical protein AAF352_01680, partial [Pseudomonadota bacterium]
TVSGGAGNDVIVAGQNEGYVTVEFTPSASASSTKYGAIGYYTTDPDTGYVVGHVIWGENDDPTQVRQITLPGSEATARNMQYFFVPAGQSPHTTLQSGQDLRFRLGQDNRYEIYRGVQRLDVSVYLTDQPATNPDTRHDVLLLGTETRIDTVGDGTYASRFTTSAALIDADHISGGAGNDVFVFRKGDGLNVVSDFNLSQDVLMISGYNAADMVVSTNEQGKVVIGFTSGQDTIVLDNQTSASNFSSANTSQMQADSDSDGRLSLDEVLSTAGKIKNTASRTPIVFVEETQENFLQTSEPDEEA